MNLIYADVLEVFSEGGMRMGKLRIRGALKDVPLDLLADAKRGDRVLVCEGVAIARVKPFAKSEPNYVSSHSW